MLFQKYCTMILKCQTVTEFTLVLSGFGINPGWTLEERSIMSALYTPRVKPLLGGEDKQRILEDLAALCWGTNGNHTS